MTLVPPIIHEIEAKTALNAVQGMPFKWSLNPYKGCRHACTYCYARAYHAFLDLPLSSFETQLFAKINIAQVLHSELHKPSWQWEPIALGTGTDPYQPLEGQYRLTRGCLEELAQIENPGSVTTKGTLVRRDVDVLSDLTRRTHFTVNISLISLDRELVHKLEPGAPAPASRLETINRLADAGIPVSVFLAPVLPGLTDDPDSLRQVVHAVAEHGATDVWTGALRLGPGVKEHFMGAIAESFPDLVSTYDQIYAGRPTLHAGYQIRIEGQVSALRREHGMAERNDESRHGSPRRKQLALPI